MSLIRVALLLASYDAVFGQINASSDVRPVALEMQESDGILTFSLRNSLERVVSGYKINLWAFSDQLIPRLACTVSSAQVPAEQRQATRIAVPKTCAVPTDASGNALRFTAKFASVHVDGRVMNYEPVRVSAN